MSDFGPRDARIEGLLREIGGMIAHQMPPGWGFTLLIFSMGLGGATFYLSNADRADMLAALQEFIDRQGPQERRETAAELAAKLLREIEARELLVSRQTMRELTALRGDQAGGGER